jgi:hypothetical protein
MAGLEAHFAKRRWRAQDMNLTTLKQHRELAEEHLAAARRHIARQRRLILDLEGAGQDTTEVRRLLAELETAQALHITHQEKKLRVLETGLLPG